MQTRRAFLKTVGLGTATLACGQRLPGANPTLSPHGGPVDGVAPEAMLDKYLDGLAFAALDRRQAAYETLKTPADIQAYQTRLRSFFVQQLGGFPERTPLQARVVGQVQGDGYRIEKVIYESLPGYLVTANLYLPTTPPPYPGVLFSCGHSANGKAIDTYQLACALMARHGLAVLSYDPVGQGERLQYVPNGAKPLFGPTQEHHLLGLRCRLAGVELARFFIWDGMRGIDYLQTRPDIIADRIGATGNSGGGTLTSYLMALDDRITCAAPSCYLTGFRRLLQTIGPQDYEQNIYGQIEGGLDHADYVLLRAPKPTLMCVATHDFFDIQGAWDVFRQSKRIYTRLGAPECVDLVEADEKHGFSVRLREGATRWLRRWLTGIDAPVRETAIKLPDEKSLHCTAEGQVLRLPGARSLFDLLAEHEARSQPRRPTPAAIRNAAGIRGVGALPPVRPNKTGDFSWEGRAGERVILTYESGLWLSALHFPARAATAAPETILYLPDGGKKAGVEKGGLGKLLGGGGRVLTFDLPGLGEMRTTVSSGGAALDAVDRRQAQKAMLVGRNLVALRAEAILLGLRFLGAAGGVRLVCGKDAAIAALHAAALEPELFSSIDLPLPPTGWAEFVRNPRLTLAAGEVVPGALTTYDLPDLIRLIPTGKLRSASI
ncbi:MAG: acetylxylan esterase [Verrucomicrobia bacterium]|nr:acetylxylan esterase [Verrucomicrobiota bacterium]